ncbi:hypothetical protein CONCODRAFT_3621 [Conidiobolus coronatus NRRL 28638]|uniref:Uncharacterized protein n=1 Tax=Conidiobolus coronatus (strain ATCC 28846 / CBS 209.66 / NRRL 28638) TaxID=796925 RepID=A0A137PEG0_CONC2|nr:hypothetical protein CONCODRAFT_3621 [Conidiobolus coronatus NRRL 28638]|eukprot:KXN73389.1 hypothetical protein CONCODRAFT_3621 [Conidiobolus coronatus NRRL 28638]
MDADWCIVCNKHINRMGAIYCSSSCEQVDSGLALETPQIRNTPALTTTTTSSTSPRLQPTTSPKLTFVTPEPFFSSSFSRRYDRFSPPALNSTTSSSFSSSSSLSSSPTLSGSFRL